MNYKKILACILCVFSMYILTGCAPSQKTKAPKKENGMKKQSSACSKPIQEDRSSEAKSSVKENRNSENNANSRDIEKSIENTSKKTVTVWVHGTRLLTKFGAQELFYSPDGMKAVKDIPENYHMHKIAKKLSELNNERFQFENFYLFGWTGKLSFEKRKEAAKELYKALVELAKEYKKLYGQYPTFRIITHSHGGNVALNLCNFYDESTPFVVSELVLLACPVQERTKIGIECPLFERAYSFFSKGEFLQVIDPQGLYQGNKIYPLFSKRVFPDNVKLSQAEIKMYGRPILHVEFLLGHFLYKLPSMLDALDKEHQLILEHKNPGNIKQDYVIIDLKKKRRKKKVNWRKHKYLIIN